jgi:hypothetical protein
MHRATNAVNYSSALALAQGVTFEIDLLRKTVPLKHG